MRLPRILLKLMKRAECLQRIYPKDRPNLEQVTVRLEICASEGFPVGFLVLRSLQRPTGNGTGVYETTYFENYYEPKEILQAVEDFNNDVLPSPTRQPFQHHQTRTPTGAPRIALERKPLPVKTPGPRPPNPPAAVPPGPPAKKEDNIDTKIKKATATGREATISDM